MRLSGTKRNDKLRGGEDHDLIDGGLGDDVIFGFAGNDVLHGDVNTEAGQGVGGDDRLIGGEGDDWLIGGVGDDRLDGGDGDDRLFGGAAIGPQDEWGNGASYGGGGPVGADTYIGGAGIDTAYLLYRDATVGVSIDVSRPGQVGAITVNGAAAGSITGVELLVFEGGAGDDRVIAPRYSPAFKIDNLSGGAGDDWLDGGGGADFLTGGAGDDRLIGGEDRDTASYEDATRGVTVDLRIDGIAQNTRGGGRDTLVSIENVNGGRGADVLIGTDRMNEIIDRLGGDDRLVGGGGDDRLRVERYVVSEATDTIANGGDGDDIIEFSAPGTFAHRATLIGGDGHDVIFVRGLADGAINAGEGRDRVSVETLYGSARVTLGSGRDVLALEDSGAGFRAERAITVTDFAPGATGDVLDLRQWLSLALDDYAPGSDPFADHLSLTAEGSATVLWADRDGAGEAYAAAPLIVFENTAPGAFVAANFTGWQASEGMPPAIWSATALP